MLRPMDDRKAAIMAKRIAGEMRARAEVVAEYLGTVESLAGLCHFVALGVTQAIVSADIPAFLASDGGHSWTEVELSTGLMLVDVTASQFGFVDVLIRMPGKPRPRIDRRPPDGYGRRWRREMYGTRVTGIVAQRLASEVADEVITGAPHDWWMLPVEKLRGELARTRTTFGRQGTALHLRASAAA